jgi:hypothetical protein
LKGESNSDKGLLSIPSSQYQAGFKTGSIEDLKDGYGPSLGTLRFNGINAIGKTLPYVGTDIRRPRIFELLSSKLPHNQECLNKLDEISHLLLRGDEVIPQIWKRELRKYLETKNQVSGHLALLALRLIVYEEVKPVNGKHFRSVDYIRYSLQYGPSFAELLKKIRGAATIKTLASRTIIDNTKYFDEILNNDLQIIIDLDRKWDYDSFLNERFLIDYIDEASDLHWSFQPVEEDNDILESFRMAARDLIESYKINDIEVPGNDQYATWINDSVTPSEEGQKINRTLMRELAKTGKIPSLMEPSKDRPMRFKRSIVPVGPANIRDTWQCYPDTLFSVKRISFLLRQVLDPIPYSAMGHPLKVTKRRKLLKKKDSQYLMFDYKKCGLTVNRKLLEILAEELEAVYPGKGMDEMLRFRNINLEQEDVTLHPLRGVGLGNCNEGVTLIQCVVGHMVKHKFGTNSIFFNDDGVFEIGDNLYRQFSWIGTILSGLGMILNMKKTFISRNNIFCEDYEIIDKEKFDYSKTQLSLVPFSNCFFSETIGSAKALFSSIKQGLIGKKIETDNFLSSLVDFYGYEFHKSERLWPFEIGGWQYFSETSLNEVLEFTFSTERFMPTCESKSFIPFIREWIHYLINHHKISKLLSKRGNIPYRSFVENPFQNPRYKSPQSEEVKGLLAKIGLQTNLQMKEGLDELYNHRGLKNAKPKIKSALARQRHSSRLNIWRSFIAYNKRIRDRFYPSWSNIMKVMNFMKGDSNLPSYYLPPSILVEGWKESYPSRKRGRYYIPKPGIKLKKNDFEGRNILLESASQGRFKKGSDIYAGKYEMLSSRERPIFSDIDLIEPGDMIYPPDYIYLFCPTKQIATTILYSKYGKVPHKWILEDTPENALKKYLNPLEEIFPFRANLWRRVKREYNKYNLNQVLRDALRLVEIDSEEDCDILFRELRVLLEEEILKPKPEKKILDSEGDPFELNYIRIDEQLSSQMIGETNMDDLIDAYDEEPDDFYYSSGEDFYVGEDDIEENFEEMENLDRISFFSAVPLERG